ncbi:MAG: right-handed parallel beta-helix repeat-containing protein [Pseudomonadales bacterium]
MKNRFLICLTGFALLVVSGISQSGFAQNAEHRAGALKSVEWSASKARVHVDCDKQQSLGQALQHARPGTTIFFTGTCHEQIQIREDYIRLRGMHGAVIDGGIGEILFPGTITVQGARGVMIKNLTVQNGPDQGIVIEANSSALLENVTTTGNTTTGVTVDSSYAELKNVNANENGSGFDFFTSATVIAQGALTAENNSGGPGVAVNGNATLELRGAIVETHNNGGDGVLLVNNANLMILSFPESQGSGVRASANRGNAGMFLANSNVAIVGSQYAGSGANFFDIKDHQGPGMLLISSNLASPFATARFNLTSNGAGMVLVDNTDVTIVGGLQISGNFGPGIVGEGAGVVRIEQNPDNPSAISGNFAPDMVLSFGTRLVLDEHIANAVICDGSVLTLRAGCS